MAETYTSGVFEINHMVIEDILKELATRRRRPQPSPVPKTYFEVSPLPNKTVMDQISALMYNALENILSETEVSVVLPSRSKSNQIFDPQLERNVLGDKVFERRLEGRDKFPLIVLFNVLYTIWEALKEDLNVTKRGLFYAKCELYGEQQVSDKAVEEACLLLKATRSSLNVISAEGKGFVLGNIEFSDDGDHIDCTRMGVGGRSIPPNMDRVGEMKSDALFILLVEKQSTFITLAQTRFYRKFRCIIVCSQGQPDLGTREFVSVVDKKFKLPIFGLFDCDPFGLRILSVYQFGSLSLSYDSKSLTTSNIHWLGLTPFDLERYKIPEHCLLPLSEEDMKEGRQLMEEDFMKHVPRWRVALQEMLDSGKKAELQALNAFGFKYLTDTYLPSKLYDMNWI